MRRIATFLKALVVAGVVTAVLIFLLFSASNYALNKITAPNQPKFGFTGNWRDYSFFGVEERPLPTANRVWADYSAWKPKTNHYSDRVYLALLGGADRQSSFRSWLSSGDTPMGAQEYTNVEFTHQDPTNGIYLLYWTLRGKHDASFLRFNSSYRLYQLQPYGDANDNPPRLLIRAIEGVKPE